MNVYVVMGTCGEYSDRNEWPVVAFLSEERAKQRVVDAERRAKELEAEHPDYHDDIPDGANEFDLGMQTSYTGTTYYYLTVEVADAKP